MLLWVLRKEKCCIENMVKLQLGELTSSRELSPVNKIHISLLFALSYNLISVQPFVFTNLETRFFHQILA